jgi:F0F1-type ATP synthase assembly protein I
MPSYHCRCDGSARKIVIKFAIKKGSSSPLRQDPSPIDKKQVRATGIAAGLGCSIVATVIVCIVGGVLLDREFGTEPWLTLTGVAIGIVAAGYQLYELATLDRADGKSGPVARGIGRVVPGKRTTVQAEDEPTQDL